MLNRRRLNNLDSRGDTIVEVMIVLAVLGLALGISYATANRSLLNARQAQESSGATELVQSQVENLHYFASSTNPAQNIFTQPHPFCIKDVQAASPIITDPAGCGFGNNNLYTILAYSCDSISPSAGTPCAGITDPHTLIVQAHWDDVVGQGTDYVTLVYKAYAQ